MKCLYYSSRETLASSTALGYYNLKMMYKFLKWNVVKSNVMLCESEWLRGADMVTIKFKIISKQFKTEHL